MQGALIAYILGMPAPTASLEEMLERVDSDEYLARSRIHLGLAWLAATFGFPTRATNHLEQVDPRALASAADIGLRFHNVATWVAMTIGDVGRFRSEQAAWIAAAAASGSVRAGCRARQRRHVLVVFRFARRGTRTYSTSFADRARDP